MALSLVIDRSGTMAGLPIVTALSRDDCVEVISFDRLPVREVTLRSPIARATINARIGAIMTGSGAEIFGALDMARVDLAQAKVTKRHVALLSFARVATLFLDDVTKDLQRAGITLSTIGLTGSDETLLQQLATGGGGRFYKVADTITLPKVFVREIEVRASSLRLDRAHELAEVLSEHGVRKADTCRSRVRARSNADPSLFLPQETRRDQRARDPTDRGCRGSGEEERRRGRSAARDSFASLDVGDAPACRRDSRAFASRRRGVVPAHAPWHAILRSTTRVLAFILLPMGMSRQDLVVAGLVAAVGVFAVIGIRVNRRRRRELDSVHRDAKSIIAREVAEVGRMLGVRPPPIVYTYATPNAASNGRDVLINPHYLHGRIEKCANAAEANGLIALIVGHELTHHTFLDALVRASTAVLHAQEFRADYWGTYCAASRGHELSAIEYDAPRSARRGSWTHPAQGARNVVRRHAAAEGRRVNPTAAGAVARSAARRARRGRASHALLPWLAVGPTLGAAERRRMLTR